MTKQKCIVSEVGSESLYAEVKTISIYGPFTFEGPITIPKGVKVYVNPIGTAATSIT